MEIEILNVAEITPETKEGLLIFDNFTKEQAGVYSIICPKKNTYTAEQILLKIEIPDRVKQLVEMTKQRFHKYEVWGSELYEIKDPILLGREADPANPTYSWYDKVFLMARWGEELDSFSVLKEKAKIIYEENCVVEAMKIKAKIDMFLSNPKIFINKAINNGESEKPEFCFNVIN